MAIINTVTIIEVTVTEKTMIHRIWYLQINPKLRKSQDDIWICDSGSYGHYCNYYKALFNVEDIKEIITVGNGKSMTATKVGSLKYQVIQFDGSGIDMTLYKFKIVHKLWVNFYYE
jgi:hypothetical protein